VKMNALSSWPLLTPRGDRAIGGDGFVPFEAAPGVSADVATRPQGHLPYWRRPARTIDLGVERASGGALAANHGALVFFRCRSTSPPSPPRDFGPHAHPGPDVQISPLFDGHRQ
jgi:hypothetical protein